MEKKILKLFILMIGVFFIGISGIKAYTITMPLDSEYEVLDQTGTRNYDVGNQIKESDFVTNPILSSAIKTNYRRTSDGDTVYCYDAGKAYYVKEQTVTYNCSTQITDNVNEIAYIFKYGYNLNGRNTYSLGSSKNEKYFVTQIAIWWFGNKGTILNGFNSSGGKLTGTYNGNSNQITQNVAKLVNDAIDSNTTSKLVLTVGQNKMNLTSDGKYYISDSIKISGTNVSDSVNLTVSGATGAFVTTNKDATSGSSSSFTLGNTVYVKVPVDNVGVSTSIKLSAKSESLKTTGTIYYCNPTTSDSSLSGYAAQGQGIIDYQPGTDTYSTDAITLTASKMSIIISKKDITGTDELPGATLVVKNSSGTPIATWTSETTSKTLNLDAGTYTLEETVAPDGYIRNTEKITFVVADDGKVTIDGKEVSEVVMKNEPIIVYISKKSINGKTELPGATLTITDKDGKIVKDLDGQELTWKSTTEQKKFHLAAGTYYLSEKIAPKGYELSEMILEFTVTSDGKVKMDKKDVDNNLIVYTNTPEAEEVKTGSFLIYIIVIGTIATGLITYFVMKKEHA